MPKSKAKHAAKWWHFPETKETKAVYAAREAFVQAYVSCDLHLARATRMRGRLETATRRYSNVIKAISE